MYQPLGLRVRVVRLFFLPESPAHLGDGGPGGLAGQVGIPAQPAQGFGLGCGKVLGVLRGEIAGGAQSGQRFQALWPNHVMVDLKTNTVNWKTTE